jgi:hypothetical protein
MGWTVPGKKFEWMSYLLGIPQYAIEMSLVQLSTTNGAHVAFVL